MAHDILIVDDEADIRMLIAGVLKDEGYATREAGNSTEAMAAIQARQPTLVILDIWLQGPDDRRAGLRQGGDRETAACALAALAGAVCRRQLRDDAPGPAGDRAVRL